MRAHDLLLTGLLLLVLVGLGSLVAGVVWPTAAAGRLMTVGAAAVAIGLIGHQLVMARLAADRARAEADTIDALPALRALGLFDVLDVRDPALRAWLDAR